MGHLQRHRHASAYQLALLLNSKDPPPYDHLSQVLGWSYFCAWSLSFWPQVVLNWQRKSVAGLSFDYQLLNFIGFSCYLAFNAGLYWSKDVQTSYNKTHDGHPAVVAVNDVFFALHAAVLTAVTLAQIAWYWDYPSWADTVRTDRILRVGVLVSVALFTVFALIYAVCIAALGAEIEGIRSWLQYLNVLAQSKVVISLFKYMPQVYMNWSRKSTVGWNIHNVLLDFCGGMLSVAQLFLDCATTSNWSGIAGDPVKFCLGFISIIFDIIFMVQHYCLYRQPRLDKTTAADDGGGSPTAARLLGDAV